MLRIRLAHRLILVLIVSLSLPLMAANKPRLSVLFPPFLPAHTLGELLDASTRIAAEIVVANDYEEFASEVARARHDLIFATPIVAGHITAGRLYRLRWQWQKKLKVAVVSTKAVPIHGIASLQGLMIAMPPRDSRQSIIFEQLLIERGQDQLLIQRLHLNSVHQPLEMVLSGQADVGLSSRADIDGLSAVQRQELVAMYFPSSVSAMMILSHKRLSEAKRQQVITAINAAIMKQADNEDSQYSGFDDVDSNTLKWLGQLSSMP